MQTSTLHYVLMKDLSGLYRAEGDYVLIEITLKSLHQLFNSFDPAPFYEKDIDPDAEAYIVDAAREINIRKPIKLVIYLPSPDAAAEKARMIQEAIHNYFSYQTQAARRDLRLALQQGRLSLAIGLSFLAACIGLRAMVPFIVRNAVVTDFLQESLLISGWVAMWRPFQVFLYDWWPIRKKIRVMEKLSSLAVEIRPARDQQTEESDSVST